MEKDRCGVLVLTALLGALLILGGTKAVAGVNVNINLGPPPVVVAEPRAVVMIPRSEVYFVPDPHIDIWRQQAARWNTARIMGGGNRSTVRIYSSERSATMG